MVTTTRVKSGESSSPMLSPRSSPHLRLLHPPRPLLHLPHPHLHVWQPRRLVLRLLLLRWQQVWKDKGNEAVLRRPIGAEGSGHPRSFLLLLCWQFEARGSGKEAWLEFRNLCPCRWVACSTMQGLGEGCKLCKAGAHHWLLERAGWVDADNRLLAALYLLQA